MQALRRGVWRSPLPQSARRLRVSVLFSYFRFFRVGAECVKCVSRRFRPRFCQFSCMTAKVRKTFHSPAAWHSSRILRLIIYSASYAFACAPPDVRALAVRQALSARLSHCRNAEKCSIFPLRREKMGYAPRAYPIFCIVDYQRLTWLLYVHVAPPVCTSRKNSKYSRRYRAYFRREKMPVCPSQVPSVARSAYPA